MRKCSPSRTAREKHGVKGSSPAWSSKKGGKKNVSSPCKKGDASTRQREGGKKKKKAGKFQLTENRGRDPRPYQIRHHLEK